MKPFIASEFISNQETPVVCRNQKPVEIITVNGRDPLPVVGYVGDLRSVQTWNKSGIFSPGQVGNWDLFFAPKIEVVHVFKDRESNELLATINGNEAGKWKTYAAYTHLGTITGPIVPPEEGK